MITSASLLIIYSLFSTSSLVTITHEYFDIVPLFYPPYKANNKQIDEIGLMTNNPN